MFDVKWSGRAGVYMAYPTTLVPKPIHHTCTTRVNASHTNVGTTSDSFGERESEYRNTFGGEICFEPLVEVPASRLASVKAAIHAELRARFGCVGKTTSWFETTDRAKVSSIVRAVAANTLAKK